MNQASMKTLIASLPIFLLGLVLLHAGEPATDLERMQGAWTVVSLTELGKAIPAAETDILEFVINKDVISVYEKGKIEVQYQVKLDPEKKPKEIDFTNLIGDNKGKTEPGIYAFDGDKLKLCLDEKRKGRPTAFEGKESETYSVIVLTKKKTAEEKKAPKKKEPAEEKKATEEKKAPDENKSTEKK
jgi:uncharacterized protein (TIGR03067 family)